MHSAIFFPQFPIASDQFWMRWPSGPAYAGARCAPFVGAPQNLANRRPPGSSWSLLAIPLRKSENLIAVAASILRGVIDLNSLAGRHCPPVQNDRSVVNRMTTLTRVTGWMGVTLKMQLTCF
jgi:hypothetical protein